MSKIQQLIQELCPGGVDVVPLSRVATVEKGKQVNRESLRDEFPYPVYNGGIRPSGRHIEANFPANTITVSQGGASAGYVNFVEEPLWVGAHCYALTPKPAILNRFLYFWVKFREEELQTSKYGAGIPALDKTTLMNLATPIPPIELQKEIVSVLEKFTQLEAELEAELEARRTQYEVTRDRLLDFSSDLDTHPLVDMVKELCPGGVPLVELAQLGKFLRGGSIRKDQLLTHGRPAIHYGEIYTTFGPFTKQTKSFVSQEHFDSQPKGEFGDLLITLSDVTPHNVGMATAWVGEEAVALGGDILAFRHTMDPKFLSFVFRTEHFQSQKRRIVTGGTVRHVSAKGLAKIKIPTPPLSVQIEIVSILEKMEALVNDGGIGIPAEIAARRKEYEYYRNKLLKFKERDAA